MGAQAAGHRHVRLGLELRATHMQIDLLVAEAKREPSRAELVSRRSLRWQPGIKRARADGVARCGDASTKGGGMIKRTGWLGGAAAILCALAIAATAQAPKNEVRKAYLGL